MKKLNNEICGDDESIRVELRQKTSKNILIVILSDPCVYARMPLMMDTISILYVHIDGRINEQSVQYKQLRCFERTIVNQYKYRNVSLRNWRHSSRLFFSRAADPKSYGSEFLMSTMSRDWFSILIEPLQ